MPAEHGFDVGDPPRHVEVTTGRHIRRLDGIDLRLSDTPAWCLRCEDMIAAEYLPPLATLRADLAERKRRLRSRRRDLRQAERTFDAASAYE